MGVCVFYAVVGSGQTLSNVLPMLREGILVGLVAPTAVDSCAVYVRAGVDSAATLRVMNPAGSGDWTWSVGPGSRAVPLWDPMLPFGFIALETSVAQTAPRSLMLVTKL